MLGHISCLVYSYIIMKNISNMMNICINITIAVAILAQVIIDDNFKNLLPHT